LIKEPTGFGRAGRAFEHVVAALGAGKNPREAIAFVRNPALSPRRRKEKINGTKLPNGPTRL